MLKRFKKEGASRDSTIMTTTTKKVPSSTSSSGASTYSSSSSSDTSAITMSSPLTRPPGAAVLRMSSLLEIDLPESGQFFDQVDFAIFDKVPSNFSAQKTKRLPSTTTRTAHSSNNTIDPSNLNPLLYTVDHLPMTPPLPTTTSNIMDDKYYMDSDTDGGSIQASPVIFNTPEGVFDNAHSSYLKNKTSAVDSRYSLSTNNSSSVERNISGSSYGSSKRDYSYSHSAQLSPSVEVVDIDTDSSYELASKYMAQGDDGQLAPEYENKSTSGKHGDQPPSASERVKNFLPFLSYQSLRDKEADEYNKTSQDPSERQSLVYQPSGLSSSSSRNYYNTQESDYKRAESHNSPHRSGPSERRPVVKKSSTTFSKKLVFSDMHNVPLNISTSATTDNKYPVNHEPVAELDEDDSLLPVKFPQPPQQSHNGRRSSVPLNASSKVMTKSQFEDYRKSILEAEQEPAANADGKRASLMATSSSPMYNNISSPVVSDDLSQDEEDEESEDEDIKKLKKRYDEGNASKDSARMRLKQDAHLSVYRQKMTKVSGNQIPALPRPASTYGLAVDDDYEDDDEYDDVPLGILKAHGFPSQPTVQPSTLRPMSSQPNLITSASASAAPSILYRTPKLGNPETASLRSYRSQGNLHSSPSPPTLPSLPSVFGNPNQNLNRGLIGEIAREEEAKLRRRSMGNTLLAMQSDPAARSSASLAPASIYNGLTGSVSPNPGGEIQVQLQQMMQMQMQMLHQIQGPAPITPPTQSNRHSMYAGGRIAPSPAPFSSGASVRSMATGISRPMSIDALRQPGMRSSVDFGTTAAPQLRGYRSQYWPTGSGSGSGRATPIQPRLVQQADESDDDDDDDEGWKQMMEKRRALKESWSKQPSAPLVL